MPAAATGEAPLPAWLLPVVWASLVITAAPAVSDAIDGWSAAPKALAAVLLWVIWSAVLLATLVPRPLSLVGLRLGAVLALVAATAAATAADAGPAAAAVAATVLAAAVAFRAATGYRFINGAAYGEERRFPLRVPPALLLGPLPLAVGVVVGGVGVGPLLLADGRIVAGLLVTGVGLPAAVALARSFWALAQRWAVLVPAGIVVKDPLTMVDPVLFLRDRVASLRPLPYPTSPADDILDLRLGALKGSLVLELTDEAMLMRTAGRSRGGQMVSARRIAFSPTDAPALLADAGRRRTAAAG